MTGSMGRGGIFNYEIHHKFQPNVGKYSMHGLYGIYWWFNRDACKWLVNPHKTGVLFHPPTNLSGRLLDCARNSRISVCLKVWKPGDSSRDLFGMINFQGLSDLHFCDQRVTWKKLVYTASFKSLQLTCSVLYKCFEK